MYISLLLLTKAVTKKNEKFLTRVDADFFKSIYFLPIKQK